MNSYWPAAFSRDWEELLPMGIRAPNGKFHFKMREMNSPERLERVRLFYQVIEKYVISSISCRINLEAFENAFVRAESWAR